MKDSSYNDPGRQMAVGLDENFDAPTLDTRWTPVAVGTGTISVFNSNLVISSPSQGAANRCCGVQTRVGPDKFRFRMKLHGSVLNGNFPGYGPFFRRSSNGYINWLLHISHSSYAWSDLLGVGFTNYTTYSTEWQAMRAYGLWRYWEIESDGTNVVYRISRNGWHYWLVSSQPYATFLGGAPDEIGIAVHPYSQPVSVSCDWIKRVA